MSEPITEWRWTDEKGRAMTKWSRAPLPFIDSVADPKGVMKVETRVVNEESDDGQP